MPVCRSQKPLPHKFAARAWFVTIGPTAMANDSAATSKVLNVFAVTDVCNIILCFYYGLYIIYTPSNVLRLPSPELHKVLPVSVV
jgi:hypothetical protein